MRHEDKISHWEYEHFITYIFLCVADSDYNISPEELDEIHDKVMRTLESDEKKFKSILEDVRKEFRYHNDFDKTELVKNNAEKFLPEMKDRKKIIDDIQDIIKADGHVDSIEMVMMRFMKKALGVH